MIENVSNQKEPLIYSVNSLEIHTQSKYYKVIDWPIRWCQRWIQFKIRTIQTKKTVTAQFDKLVKIRRRRAAAEKKQSPKQNYNAHNWESVEKSADDLQNKSNRINRSKRSRNSKGRDRKVYLEGVVFRRSLCVCVLYGTVHCVEYIWYIGVQCLLAKMPEPTMCSGISVSLCIVQLLPQHIVTNTHK